MYHRVAEESFDPWGLAVTPANFHDQIRWLSQNCTILRLSEFASLHRRRRLPNGAVAVTMDDGYSCNIETAAPILEQYGVAATIFLPADLIKQGQPFWWDELETMILGHEGSTMALEGDSIDIGQKTAEDRIWEARLPPRTARQAAFLDIHARMVSMRPAELSRAMDQLRRQTGNRSEIPPNKCLITSDQTRTSWQFIEFGSHTRTHPWLVGLSPLKQHGEICGSIDQCEALTGVRPTTLAYPFGVFDERSEQLAAEAGFECACTTRGYTVSSKSRMFALPRIAVGNWSSARLERVLARTRAE